LGTISAPPGGLMISYSFDNGSTWHPHYFATGDDRFISGCCDPSAAFDRFGNLWFSYLDGDADEAIVMLSTDGGVSYKQVADFKDVSNEATGSDQPKLAVGANSIFLVWHDAADTGEPDGQLEVASAFFSGLGQWQEFFGVVPLVVPPNPNGGFENFGG